jgi:hypothetical protein
MTWSSNQRKGTARHEYFFALSLLETVMGSREVAARGGLFDCLPIIAERHQFMKNNNPLNRDLVWTDIFWIIGWLYLTLPTLIIWLLRRGKNKSATKQEKS